MRIGSFVTGVLALAALEVVTSTPGAANRTAALPLAAAGIAKRLFDPNFALIPNWHDPSAPTQEAKPLIDQPLPAPTAKSPTPTRGLARPVLQ